MINRFLSSQGEGTGIFGLNEFPGNTKVKLGLIH